VIYNAIFILAQAEKFVKPTWQGNAVASNILFDFDGPSCHQQKYCNPPPLLHHKANFSILTSKELKLLVKIKFFNLLILLCFFTYECCREIFYFPLNIADLIKLRRLVKRRATHMSALLITGLRLFIKSMS